MSRVSDANVGKEEISKVLSSCHEQFSEINEDQIHALKADWIATFVQNRKIPQLDSYLWHLFSFGHLGCSGQMAIDNFLNQNQCDYYIINDQCTFGFKISNGKTHLIENYADDIYYFHHNFKWTFARTHEEPHFGPYFLLKKGQKNRSSPTPSIS